MTESTRIVSASTPRLPLPSRHANDLQFFRANLTPGSEGVAGPDPEAGQRFVSEIHFANFFARKVADILAMQRLEIGVVEDRDFQTAFAFSPSDQRWHGFISSHRLSYQDVRTELSRR